MLQFQIRSFYPNAWRKDGNSIIIHMVLSKVSQNWSEMISIRYCDSPGKPEQALELVGFDIMHQGRSQTLDLGGAKHMLKKFLTCN